MFLRGFIFALFAVVVVCAPLKDIAEIRQPSLNARANGSGPPKWYYPLTIAAACFFPRRRPTAPPVPLPDRVLMPMLTTMLDQNEYPIMDPPTIQQVPWVIAEQRNTQIQFQYRAWRTVDNGFGHRSAYVQTQVINNSRRPGVINTAEVHLVTTRPGQVTQYQTMRLVTNTLVQTFGFMYQSDGQTTAEGAGIWCIYYYIFKY